SGRLSSTSLPSLSLRLAAPSTTSRRFTPESLVAPTTLPAGDSENRTALMTTSWPASRGPSAFGSVTSPFFAVTLASLWAFSGLRDTVVTVWPRDTASLVRRVPILPVPPTIAIFMSLLSSSVNGFVRQDEVGAAFADHDGGRVGVAADDIRHDRGVRNSQARDATHLEPRIEHRHLVAVRSHLAGAHRMEQRRCVPERIIAQFSIGRDAGTGHDLLAEIGLEGRRRQDLPRRLDAVHQHRDVLFVVEEIWNHFGPHARVARCELHRAAALGPQHGKIDAEAVEIRDIPIRHLVGRHEGELQIGVLHVGPAAREAA